MITLDIRSIGKARKEMSLNGLEVEGKPPELTVKKEYDDSVKFESIYFQAFKKGVSGLGFVSGMAEMKKNGRIIFY